MAEISLLKKGFELNLTVIRLAIQDEFRVELLLLSIKRVSLDIRLECLLGTLYGRFIRLVYIGAATDSQHTGDYASWNGLSRPQYSLGDPSLIAKCEIFMTKLIYKKIEYEKKMCQVWQSNHGLWCEW